MKDEPIPIPSTRFFLGSRAVGGSLPCLQGQSNALPCRPSSAQVRASVRARTLCFLAVAGPLFHSFIRCLRLPGTEAGLASQSAGHSLLPVLRHAGPPAERSVHSMMPSMLYGGAPPHVSRIHPCHGDRVFYSLRRSGPVRTT
jgi:hypothetical protein